MTKTASGKIPNTDITVNIDSNKNITILSKDNTNSICAICIPNSNKVIVAYRDIIKYNYGKTVVGEIIDNNISFGSPSLFNGCNTNNISIAYDPKANRIIVAYTTNKYGGVILGSINSNNIKFWYETIIEPIRIDYISVAYDYYSDKVIVAYSNKNGNFAIVGYIREDEHTIIFGYPKAFNWSNKVSKLIANYDSASNKVIIIYRNNNELYDTAVVGKVYDKTIIFDELLIFSDYDELITHNLEKAPAFRLMLNYKWCGYNNFW